MLAPNKEIIQRIQKLRQMCRGYIRRPKAIKQKTKLEGYQCGQHERKGEHENRNKK